jgi:18S rRNA (guanine1575-N7)-methyltransferase
MSYKTNLKQYYGDSEAKKYTTKYVFKLPSLELINPTFFSTRNQQIQADMTYRALELLNLPPNEPAFLLDIGCGSGLSGEILDEQGYIWAGVDIAPSMLGEP